MRAVGTSSFGGPEVLGVVDVPLPEPGAGEVRVRVQAASINNFDLVARAGYLGDMLPQGPLYVFGWDVAGTVDATGQGVTGFVEGDAVIGMSDWLDTRVGTQAEYVVLTASALAPQPTGSAPPEAATLPVNAHTAAKALAMLALEPGQRLLITGAAGAVGGYALELARHAGIEVTALASPGDEDFVTRRGARFVPRAPDWVAALEAALPEGADGLLDAATLGPSAIALVRDGGGFASLTPPMTPEPQRGINVHQVHAHSNGAELTELAALAAKGVLTLRLNRSFPFEQAAQAHELIARGGLRGRVVLTP